MTSPKSGVVRPRLRALWCLSLGVLFLTACGEVEPFSLAFVDVTPANARLGETTTVRFEARDARGVPMGGVPVTFSLEPSVDGVELRETSVLTNKGDGIAQTTVVVRSNRVSSVVVVATSAGNKQARSMPLAFSGASPNAAHLGFSCGPIDGEGSSGVRAIRAYDSARHLNEGVKLPCSAHVGDRNGVGLPDVQVTFLAEAGTIGSGSTSVTDVVGNADVLYKASMPLPRDVAPTTYFYLPADGRPSGAAPALYTDAFAAPEWMHPHLWAANPYAFVYDDGTENWNAPRPEPRRPDPLVEDPRNPGQPRVNNPRDNLVTLIAITRGEEWFDDRNNNGVRDGVGPDGEPFEDTTEPFVDADDDGTWSEGEVFVDTNGNGKWDGKNGEYDLSTNIWREEKILWTGLPHRLDREAVGDGWLPVGLRIDPVTGLPDERTVRVTPRGANIDPLVFALSDPWFNTPARAGTSDGCRAVVSNDSFRVTNAQVGGQGMAIEYPSIEVLALSVEDNRPPPRRLPDGTLDPATDPANLPSSADVEVLCTLTSSLVEGSTATLSLGSARVQFSP